MVNREIAIITTIAAILISIPLTFFPVFQAQGGPQKKYALVYVTDCQ